MIHDYNRKKKNNNRLRTGHLMAPEVVYIIGRDNGYLNRKPARGPSNPW